MSDESEIDNSDNVLAFTKRFDENADIREMRNVVEAEPHKSYCRHEKTLINEHLRLLTCRLCEKVLDPFDYILGIAKKETRLDWELSGLRGEIKDHREGLEKLKREEVNCRARIKTAQFNLNELNTSIYKAEKDNG